MKTNYEQAKEVKIILCLYLLINPYLVLYTHEGMLVNDLNLYENCETDLDSPYEAMFTIPLDVNTKTDEEIAKPTESHKQKRIAMFNSFEKQKQDSEFKPESYPIGKITFVLSVFVATCPELRQAFYDRYTGPVPLITMFLLTYLRASHYQMVTF